MAPLRARAVLALVLACGGCSSANPVGTPGDGGLADAPVVGGDARVGSIDARIGIDARLADDGGLACGTSGDSCLTTSCCTGFMCCSGNPVPPGQSICYPDQCPVSDRNLKTGIVAVDAEAVLARLTDLPISTWRYVWEPAEVRHVGPMAQDFKAVFGLGTTDQRIFSVDEGGVALAAIQALQRQVEGLREENAALRKRLDRLEAGARTAK